MIFLDLFENNKLPTNKKDVAEGSGLDQILARYPEEVENFKQGGDLDYDLESALWDYYFNRGDIRNYNADAGEWIAQQLASELGLNEQGVAEANAPFGTMGRGIRPPSGGATTQSNGIRPPSNIASSAPVAATSNWQAPHGDEQNEFRLFKSGEKPAVIARGGIRKLYQPLLDTGEYPFKIVNSQGAESLIIGQPTEEDRVKKIYTLVQTASNRAEAGDFSAYNNSNYHRLLGTLLGYPKDKIEQFVTNYFKDKEDLAQQHFQMENNGVGKGYELDKFKIKSGKFPEPREPRFKGDQGSKSETLGRDGKIYHWQDPRAKQGVAEGDITQLEKDIAAAPVEPIANMEADEKIGGRYDADEFDSMVNRLKKLAGAGPLKTVYDPQTRRYKNVPVAQQPGDKK